MSSNPSPEAMSAAERICGMFDVGTRWTNFDDTEHGFTPAPVETVAFAIDAAYAERLERLERERDAYRAALVGAWVDYGSLPYQIGTDECDRLAYHYVKDWKDQPIQSVYNLDAQAVLDIPESYAVNGIPEHAVAALQSPSEGDGK